MVYVGLGARMGSKFGMIGRFRQQIEASKIISGQYIRLDKFIAHKKQEAQVFL